MKARTLTLAALAVGLLGASTLAQAYDAARPEGKADCKAALQLEFRLADVAPSRWDALVKGAQARDRDELLADIGLGRRLAAVVARQLMLPMGTEATDTVSEKSRAAFVQACRDMQRDGWWDALPDAGRSLRRRLAGEIWNALRR